MDPIYVISSALGIVVILAGFWGFIGTQFVRKDVAAEQTRRIDEKLDGIQEGLTALSVKMDGAIVKTTVDEVANKLTEIYAGRIAMGGVACPVLIPPRP